MVYRDEVKILNGKHHKMVIGSRDMAYCGLFGAAALLLPPVFHLLKLGHVFMPMYLPLVTLAFFANGGIAALTALLVPIISAAATGMPPFYPPIAPVMSIELSLIALIINWMQKKHSSMPVWLILILALLGGRIINAALLYCAALAIKVPAGFVAGISFFSGWPGIILMIIVIPRLIALKKINRAL